MRRARRSIGSAPRSSGSRWGVWDGYEVTLAPRTYVDARCSAPAGWRSCCRPTRPRPSEPDRAARPRRRAAAGRRRRHRPRQLRRRAAPRDAGAPGPSATASSWRWRARALERDMPVLGICRGMQLLNVARGGTLDQHLPESIGHERHRTRRRRPSATTRCGSSPGSLAARGGRRRAASRSSPTTTRGSTSSARGCVVSGWSVEDDAGRGDRAARRALRPRRPLAPRGGRARAR